MTSKEWAKVCFLVPAYNEGAVVKEVIAKLVGIGAQVVVVDDASSDNTFEEIRKVKGAAALRHTINTGQGGALDTAIHYALNYTNAEYFITYDADGQHQLDDVEGMVKAVEEKKVDVVLGTRFAGKVPKNMKKSKHVLLKAAVFFTNVTSGVKVTDTHNGLRLFTRDGLSKIHITKYGMAHASEILHQIAKEELRYVEEPVTIVYTEHSMAKGQSSINSINILFDMMIGGRR